MAHWTTFAGLAAPEPGEGSTQVLNGDFVYRNPDLIAQLLRIGAISHRHDAHPNLPNPVAPLTLAPGVATGALSAATTYWMTYTVTDRDGGETMPAAPASAITGGQVDPPSFAPSAGVDFAGGIMPAGNYAYTLTYTDGKGGETPIGPVTWVYIEPGHASAEVRLVGLDAELTGHGGNASQWRMWRSYEGADWHLVTQSGASAFTDAGFDPPDNPARPPDGNTTGIVPGSLLMTLPSSDPAIASGAQINIYLSTSSDFFSPSLFEQVPVACAGTTIGVTNAEVSDGQPPHASLSLPGATKIVGVRDVIGWQSLQASAAGGSARSQGELLFRGTGGATVGVTDLGGGSALVTIGDSDSATTGVGVGNGPTPVVNPASFIEFTGSGGTGVAVTSLGSGSAQVLISASAGAGGGGMSIASAAVTASGSAAVGSPFSQLVVVGTPGYVTTEGTSEVLQLDPLPLLYKDGFDSALTLGATDATPLKSTAGSPAIAGSQLSGGGGDARVLVNLAFFGRKPVRDCAIQAKIIPSGSPDIALGLGNFSQWVQLNGGTLSIKTFVGGTTTLSSPSLSPTAGVAIWLRLELRAGQFIVEVWSKDPATRIPGDSPTLSQAVSAGANRLGWGWPGVRFNNANDLVDDLKVWLYPEAAE